jgi:hypothetical protein
MELAARPDVSELDRVASPPSGAGAIPMEALAGLGLGDTTCEAGSRLVLRSKLAYFRGALLRA